MIRYSSFRFLRAIFTLWGVVTIVFVIPRLVGDPAVVMAPLATEAQSIEIVRKNMGLDKPIIVQYAIYMNGILHGDLGVSYLFRTPTMGIILKRFPATLQLALSALGLAIVFGIPLGIISAVKKGTIFDTVSRTAAVLGQSMPPYWTALVLILLFCVKWQLFPIRGPDEGLANLHQLVLPSIALGWFATGPIARLTRSSMLEVLDRDYITMARMKGLKDTTVLGKHALRNAIIPVLTYLSITFGYMLGGVVIIESIFTWPGLGRTVLQGIYNWDFPLVQTATILGSSLFIFINFLVDITYGLVDPRVRY